MNSSFETSYMDQFVLKRYKISPYKVPQLEDYLKFAKSNYNKDEHYDTLNRITDMLVYLSTDKYIVDGVLHYNEYSLLYDYNTISVYCINIIGYTHLLQLKK